MNRLMSRKCLRRACRIFTRKFDSRAEPPIEYWGKGPRIGSALRAHAGQAIPGSREFHCRNESTMRRWNVSEVGGRSRPWPVLLAFGVLFVLSGNQSPCCAQEGAPNEAEKDAPRPIGQFLSLPGTLDDAVYGR